MNKLIAAIGFVMMAGISCIPVTVDETMGSLSGVVSDKATGEPVSGVGLILSPGGNSSVTGSDGVFSFTNLPAGEYTISFEKSGYRKGSKTISVLSGDDNAVHLLIDRIPETITIDREVLDFGDNASMNTVSFNIVNTYYSDLKYEIIENCGWIVKVDPASGELMYGKTGTVIVTIDRDLLSPGLNETVLVVRTSGQGSSELIVRAIGVEKRKPSLNVLEPTECKASSVILNAEITDSGIPVYTERGFVYSESPMPDVSNAIAKISASVTDDIKFSAKLQSLIIGREYYVRSYATNAVGTAYSTNQISIKTAATLPEVELSNISVDGLADLARLYGKISDAGDPGYYEKGFVYSITEMCPTIYDSKIVVPGDNNGYFDAKMSSLEYDTDYYVRAYALNEAGAAYSETRTVRIDTALPIVKTHSESDLDAERDIVVLHGEIADVGIPAYTERGFVYSDVYQTPTIYDSKIVVSGTGKGLYEYRSAIPLDRKYYVRAYAINAKGVSYGDVIEFGEKDFISLEPMTIAVMAKDLGSGNWSDMSALCEHSTHAGYTDWRAPTKSELSYIYLHRNSIGGFDNNASYWCSSSNPSTRSFISKAEYYYIQWWDGTLVVTSDWHKDLNIRCVRTLE